MTRMLRLKFRRYVIVGAIGAGALGLAIGTAATASASTTAAAWATPSPTPTVHYTPPPKHHKPKPRPEVVCFFSLETEHDAIPANGGGYAAPVSATTDSYGQPKGAPAEESVEVVQLVKVCVTEEHGKPESVTVVDESKPYAWLDAPGGYDPTPSGLPASIGAMLTQ
jgi:hypothetical protein